MLEVFRNTNGRDSRPCVLHETVRAERLECASAVQLTASFFNGDAGRCRCARLSAQPMPVQRHEEVIETCMHSQIQGAVITQLRDGKSTASPRAMQSFEAIVSIIASCSLGKACPSCNVAVSQLQCSLNLTVHACLDHFLAGLASISSPHVHSALLFRGCRCSRPSFVVIMASQVSRLESSSMP